MTKVALQAGGSDMRAGRQDIRLGDERTGRTTLHVYIHVTTHSDLYRSTDRYLNAACHWTQQPAKGRYGFNKHLTNSSKKTMKKINQSNVQGNADQEPIK